MALIVLNRKSLELEIKVGILENYKPTKDIKALYKEMSDVKVCFEDKLKSLTDGEIETQKVLKLFKEHPEKASEWQDFLKNEFNEKLESVKDKIEKINEKICPNFGELK